MTSYHSFVYHHQIVISCKHVQHCLIREALILDQKLVSLARPHHLKTQNLLGVMPEFQWQRG